MKTLKYKDVHRNAYRDLAKRGPRWASSWKRVYSQKDLHSVLGYIPPVEIEVQVAA